MANVDEVRQAAQRLSAKDEESLLLQIGMVEKELQKNPAIAEDPHFAPKYQSETMGGLDDLKRIGRRVLDRWNRELYGMVCGGKPGDQKDRDAILSALNLGEAAVIAAVAGVLISLGVPAPIAAALAPLIVKRFIWPAKDELCTAWGEGFQATQ